MLRFLIALHRWLGVALCVPFLVWFLSGIGMMYWGMPAVTARDRLGRSAPLDPAAVQLSPVEAAERIGIEPSPRNVRLSVFDGRPAYRFRDGGRERIVYADTGDEQGPASRFLRNRVASAWTGQPIDTAVVESVREPDQWIVGSQLRALRPLWKYSWPNGEEVYVGESGEVLMYTTPATRLQAYLSAVPHWMYFTPLRKHQPVWIRLTTYGAMIGTAGAIVGVVIAAWMYSPRKKYRYAGAPSRVPYRGQKRLHTIFGLVFGIATVTWTFSGSLAFLPFPSPQPASSAPRAGSGRGQEDGPRAGPFRRAARGPDVEQALRGRLDMADVAGVHPRDLLARHAGLGARELSFTSFDGRPMYVLTLADGTSRRFWLDGRAVDSLDRERIEEIVKSVLPDPAAAEIELMDEYDYHYLDRRRERPLPVLRVLTHDANGTRYYIDPQTASVVGTYSDRNRLRRFFYNGLHSLSFPWLYNNRPLWDIVVITCMLGGAGLSTTAIVLAWRAVGRKLRQAARQRQPLSRAVPQS